MFLETGSGKTLIAIMLLRRYSYLLRKPSPFVAVFLVPQVVLVQQVYACYLCQLQTPLSTLGIHIITHTFPPYLSLWLCLDCTLSISLTRAFSYYLYYQQADAIKMHTDLKVGMYWGDMGVDFWDAKMWKQQIEEFEVGFLMMK